MERLIYTVKVFQRSTGWYSKSWWGAQLSCWKHLKAQMDTVKQMWMLPDLPLQEEHFWNIATCSWNRALLERQQLPCAEPSVDQLCQGLGCAPGIPSCGVRWAIQRWGDMQGPARLQEPGQSARSWVARQHPFVLLGHWISSSKARGSLLFGLTSWLASRQSNLFRCYHFQRKPQHHFWYGCAIQCLLPSGIEIQDKIYPSLENANLVSLPAKNFFFWHQTKKLLLSLEPYRIDT